MLLFYVFDIFEKDVVAKVSLFLTAIISFVLAYIIGIKKNKNGLSNGMIIGISIAMISLIIHFTLKTLYFDTFYIRGLVFMFSGAAGGIIGVNKMKETL